MPCGSTLPIHNKPCSPARACRQALQFSAQNILQHGLIQRQVSHQLLQYAVLIFQLLQSSLFVRQQSVVLLFPIEICHLRNPRLAADLRNRVTIGTLLQNERFLPWRLQQRASV